MMHALTEQIDALAEKIADDIKHGP
jgi:hypothetical protein